jgi:excinuclease ABC subunit B
VTGVQTCALPIFMYADTITDSMRRAMGETERRREIQMAYNTEHGITPKTIEKRVKELIETTKVAETPAAYKADRIGSMNRNDMLELAANLEKEMRLASRQLEFERAAELRDMIVELRQKAGDGPVKGKAATGGKNARRPRK